MLLHCNSCEYDYKKSNTHSLSLSFCIVISPVDEQCAGFTFQPKLSGVNIVQGECMFYETVISSDGRPDTSCFVSGEQHCTLYLVHLFLHSFGYNAYIQYPLHIVFTPNRSVLYNHETLVCSPSSSICVNGYYVLLGRGTNCSCEH